MKSVLLMSILVAALVASPVAAQEDEVSASTEASEETGTPAPSEPATTDGAPSAPEASAGPEEASAPEQAAPPPSVAATDPLPDGNDFRIGFWEIDFIAVDRAPRGTTFRLLDFKIFRLLEVGQGPDYQAFSFFEMPELLSLFTSRQEGATSELRVMDVQAVSLALVRQTQESENISSSEYMKLPVLGPLFAVQTTEEQPTSERQTYLFLLRQDVPR